MAMNWFLIIFIGIIVLIFILSKVLGVKQNVFTFIIVALVLFSFLSLVFAFSGKDVSINSFADLKDAGTVYFSWLANAFSNVKIITTEAIKMDWQINNTEKTS